MGWAKEAAETIRTMEQARSSARDWTLFAKQQISANADSLWADLVAQVTSDVEEIESAGTRKSLRVERFGNTLRVQRFLAPLQNLEFIYTSSQKLTVLWNGEAAAYRFGVDEHGQVSWIDESGIPLTGEQVSFQSFRSLVALYQQGFPTILSA